MKKKTYETEKKNKNNKWSKKKLRWNKDQDI